jgi:hypothetical protein
MPEVLAIEQMFEKKPPEGHARPICAGRHHAAVFLE